MAQQDLERRIVADSAEGSPTGEELVKRTPQRIEIGTVGDRVSGRGLFRRHVVDRSKDLTAAGQFRAGTWSLIESGQTEIENLDGPQARQHEIGRFDVPMHQSKPVGMVKSHGGL